MTRFSPETPKDLVITHMEPISKLIIMSLNTALTETKRQFHSLGTPLVPGKPHDRSYFSHTMRYITKRGLDESGLQARIEEESESPYQLGQAANTGIVLQIVDTIARLLKSPIDEDLPRAGSESRANFYEQRQYKLVFPPFGEDTAEHRPENLDEENAFHLVYAWEVSSDLGRVFLKLVCPNDRSGKHQWQHVFNAADMGDTGSLVQATSSPQTTTPLSAAAAAANTDLDLSPREDEHKKDQVKLGAAKRA